MTKRKQLKKLTNRDKKGRFVSKGGWLRLITGLAAALLLALALVEGGEYVISSRQNAPIVSPLPDSTPPVTPKERRDTTSSIIDRYLRKKGSPLEGLGSVFYDEAQKRGFHPYILVAVAGAESSFGKHTRGNHNFLGWARGKVGFSSDSDCIEKVAQKIAELPYYRDFLATGEVAEFCLSYNAPEARSYCKTIRKFMSELKEEEMRPF